MLIDMLIFRSALVRPPTGSQSGLFEARPRDFIRIEPPTNSELRQSTAQDAARP